MIRGSQKAPASSSEMLGAGLEVWHLVVESQMVIAMRLLGMAGIWAVKPDENMRMVGEKWTGFTDAALAAQSSVWRGERPDQVMVAAIRPIRARTYRNTRRLTRNGSRDFSALLPARAFETLPGAAAPMTPFMMLLVIWRKLTGAAGPKGALLEGAAYPMLGAPLRFDSLPAPQGELIEATAQEVQMIAPLPEPKAAGETLDPAPKLRRAPGLGRRLRNLFRRSDETQDT